MAAQRLQAAFLGLVAAALRLLRILARLRPILRSTFRHYVNSSDRSAAHTIKAACRSIVGAYGVTATYSLLAVAHPRGQTRRYTVAVHSSVDTRGKNPAIAIGFLSTPIGARKSLAKTICNAIGIGDIVSVLALCPAGGGISARAEEQMSVPTLAMRNMYIGRMSLLAPDICPVRWRCGARRKGCCNYNAKESGCYLAPQLRRTLFVRP